MTIQTQTVAVMGQRKFVAEYAGKNVFWVSSALGADTNPGTRAKPFASIDYAVGRCTADQGDVILVKENYSETVLAAGGITFDVAGISVIGLGSQGQRPTITCGASGGAAGSGVLVSANGVTLENMVFIANVASATGTVEVTGTDCTLRGLRFRDSSASLMHLNVINQSGADNTADRLTIVDCHYVGLATTASAAFLNMANTIDGLQMNACTYAHLGTTSAIIGCDTGALLTNCLITNNYCQTKAGAASVFILNVTTSGFTGQCNRNYAKHLWTSSELMHVGTSGLTWNGNFASGVNDKSGYILPTADVDN